MTEFDKGIDLYELIDLDLPDPTEFENEDNDSKNSPINSDPENIIPF